MKINVIAFTSGGARLAEKLFQQLEGVEIFAMGSFPNTLGIEPIVMPLNQWTKERFKTGSALVFIGAVGIAVRAVAPCVMSKTTDPAVVVVDEQGKYVIPILSGHIGGANDLAVTIAGLIGGQPIITTATDLNQVFAVDNWAKKAGYHIVNPEQIKNISSALLRGETIGISSDFEIVGKLTKGLAVGTDFENGIVVSRNPKPLFKNTLLLIPKQFVLGVGCRKNTDSGVFESTIISLLAENNISINEIGTICSIDIKAKEPAITNFVDQHRLVFKTFTAPELRAAKGEFTHSDFVEGTVGVGNVCERACSLVSSNIILRKQAVNGITLAVSEIDWRVTFDN